MPCSHPTLPSQLTHWDLPPLVVDWFREKGIESLFDWQVECLGKEDVQRGGNLVYSAPTSAGKSLVADVLLLKQVFKFNKKAMVIEPFVALVREKAIALDSMLFSSRVKVGAFGGAYYTPGGMVAASVAVCTIEKANNFINKLVIRHELSDLGIIVVDEIHYLGEEKRGYQLETLLSKVLFHNSRQPPNKRIQIVGLSATIPNLKEIADWLKATSYVTEYRPLPLVEKIKIGNKLFDAESYMRDPNCQPLETIEPTRFAIDQDFDDLFCLCLDAMAKGHSVLVFCESRRECEIMATGLARQMTKTIGNLLKLQKVQMVNNLRAQISNGKMREIISELEQCPTARSNNIVEVLKMGIGFHHAGLPVGEREIVEDGFKTGTIKTLMATSTLCSGVNLPVRLVIIRSPLMISGSPTTFQREMLCPIKYRQMIGRAGRKKTDTCGESILFCQPENKDVAIRLLQASLGNISSSLLRGHQGGECDSSGLRKAVLDAIANGSVCSRRQLDKYLESTFWLSYKTSADAIDFFRTAVEEVLRFLTCKKFIEQLTPGCYRPTRLGNAVLASGIHPDECLGLLQDLMEARKGICLLNDLHIIYLITPNEIVREMNIKDWKHYSKIWHGLDDTCQYVGRQVGIDELVLARRVRGFSNTLQDDKERRYRRFWVALIIYDLTGEMQHLEICKKFGVSEAFVNQVQMAIAHSAGVVSIFCRKLGYHNIAAIVTPLGPMIDFSSQRDLWDLMRLNITRRLARGLFESGYRNVMALAKAKRLDIEFLIRQLQPFKGEQSFTENDTPSLWVPELSKNMTTLEYANYLVDTARKFVKIEDNPDILLMMDNKKYQSIHMLDQPSPAKRRRIWIDTYHPE